MLPSLDQSNRILVAPLHWGLGHATRCIPIIDYYLSMGKEVAIAGDSSSFELLKRRYPHLPAFELPGYNIRYSSNMVWSMLTQSHHLLRTYISEKKRVKQIIKEWQADTIISDNRFGVFAPGILNIYISHQTNILHSNGIIASLANSIHHKFISNFDECWIPDSLDQRLSGKLSNGNVSNLTKRYIGSLSRMNIKDQPEDIDVLVLLSGPEPARTILAQKLNVLLQKETHLNIFWVNGAEKKVTGSDHISEFGIVDQLQLQDMISRAKTIITRSGYSTIMDLQGLDKNIIYIPTPGQTEQEYLGELHDGGKVKKVAQAEIIRCLSKTLNCESDERL